MKDTDIHGEFTAVAATKQAEMLHKQLNHTGNSRSLDTDKPYKQKFLYLLKPVVLIQ